ncbi:MAG: transcription termination factor NusA [Patescibacteria group bacterium]|nr:transcription termination factor NusA [Patescibacteria group bacterium]MDD5715581.1 transcription termination factor NusA [Patescibacteria group bacterium]
MARENEILQAAKQICEEKNITLESVIETIEAALAVAYRKDFGEKNQNIKVEFDMVTGGSRVFDVKTVVSDEKAALTEKLREEKRLQEEADAATTGTADAPQTAPEATGQKAENIAESDDEKIERFNPKTEITVTEAQAVKKGAAEGDVIKTELFPPAAYGRMAAQTAKQVIIQRLREAEREKIFKEFKEREHEIINGTVQRVEGRMVLIDLGQTTALLPPPEQIPHERYTPGQRLKYYVVGVSQTSKGPEIILSRSHPEMVAKLFSVEVPEIGNGSVVIKAIAREAGSRTKIAVATTQRNIDPVGSCVGQRGSRVQTIISEVGGEKIDIIEWDDDPVRFITNSLSPAKVLGVKLNQDEKTAIVEVKEDQLSLAIGKAGQNVRLSAKLSGWKIDIVSDTMPKKDAAGAVPQTEAGEAAPAPQAQAQAEATVAGTPSTEAAQPVIPQPEPETPAAPADEKTETPTQ